jgi:hypothetical protein
MKTIQYAIDKDTGLIISRVGSEVAIPVLDFEHMKPENHFETVYNIEKFGIFDTIGMRLTWTRKIPTNYKNLHRKFWDMKPLT